MKTKKFDAVQSSRKWREACSKETAGMSFEELRAHLDKCGTRSNLAKTLKKRVVRKKKPLIPA
jgi:hypothetical protein|tara:strand:- start:126 stop:314 length:189 start_codon:yes stop_codon:yes gene_type:complete